MLFSALGSAWIRYSDGFTQKKIKTWLIQYKVKCLYFKYGPQSHQFKLVHLS